jgi:protein SCO1/2
MTHPIRAWLPFIAVAVVFTAAVIWGAGELTPRRSLPVLQPGDLNPALVDAEVRHQERHRILPFTLVNQLGDSVSEKDVEGQILVVDFFFTRCPTICPIMTQQLTRVQSAFASEARMHILSHSVTPQADSVSVLRSYAEKFGANSDRWWFLTGEKAHIYHLSRRSYFSCLEEGDGGLQDFVHTENVALVDASGRIRGMYDGTDGEEVDQLIEDVQLLIQDLEENTNP